MNNIYFVVFLIAGIQVRGNEAWKNSYDTPLNFQCPTGQSISEITSQHHNGYEDRRWDFKCKISSASPSCFWTGYVNGFDRPFHFSCPDNHIISGMSSYHQNNQEDRRWKFSCCRVNNFCNQYCYWAPYVNNFDEQFTWHVPHHNDLVGVGSYHDNRADQHHNRYEDRMWDFRCKESHASTSCFWTGYVNGFDKPFQYICPGNNIISGMSSYHQNWQEDRRWKFYCCKAYHHCHHSCKWTPYVNTFDERFTWHVPHHHNLVGIGSYHHNWFEDRRWRFKYCASTC